MAAFTTSPFVAGMAPVNQQNNYPQQPVQQMYNSFAWVQGEAAAKAYYVSPGTTTLLMDSENPVLYMKSTDMSGRPLPMEVRYLVTKEEFDKIQNGSDSQNSMENYITRDEFQEYVSSAERKFVIKRERSNNGKSSV